jgi:hypothetical protein
MSPDILSGLRQQVDEFKSLRIQRLNVALSGAHSTVDWARRPAAARSANNSGRVGSDLARLSVSRQCRCHDRFSGPHWCRVLRHARPALALPRKRGRARVLGPYRTERRLFSLLFSLCYLVSSDLRSQSSNMSRGTFHCYHHQYPE